MVWPGVSPGFRQLWLGFGWVFGQVGCFAWFWPGFGGFWLGYGQVFWWAWARILPRVFLGFGLDLARNFAGFWLGFSREFCQALARCFAGFWLGFCQVFGQPFAGLLSGLPGL